jgi:hypothetical protein
MIILNLSERSEENCKQKTSSKIAGPRYLEYTTKIPSQHSLFTLMIQDFCRVKRRPLKGD